MTKQLISSSKLPASVFSLMSEPSWIFQPSLKDFEHYLASMWNEHNCTLLEHSLALTFFGFGMKTDLFQSCGHCWVFQICWPIECSTFTASSFRIWNSSTGISSPLLALFIMILPRREYQTTWSASWEICMQVRKQQLELDMEQQTGSK